MSQAFDPRDFLVEPGAPRWESFRAHYPGCAVCAERVAGWTRLEGLLRASAFQPGAHPEGEFLVAFRRRPDLLSPLELRALAAHLRDCAPCRDALEASLGMLGVLGRGPSDLTPASVP